MQRGCSRLRACGLPAAQVRGLARGRRRRPAAGCPALPVLSRGCRAGVAARPACATLGGARADRSCPPAAGDWLSGRAPRSHRGGHWFDPSIAHSIRPAQRLLVQVSSYFEGETFGISGRNLGDHLLPASQGRQVVNCRRGCRWVRRGLAGCFAQRREERVQQRNGGVWAEGRSGAQGVLPAGLEGRLQLVAHPVGGHTHPRYRTVQRRPEASSSRLRRRGSRTADPVDDLAPLRTRRNGKPGPRGAGWYIRPL